MRIKRGITVRYSYTTDKGEKKWDMTGIRDISETGMSVSTQHKFSSNDILTFLIKIPSRPLEWIEFTARVVGSEEMKSITGETLRAVHITRLEFINLKEDQKELIREYITWSLSRKKDIL